MHSSTQLITTALTRPPTGLSQCVLANLIYRKYLKGYISHKARTLVLSKQQPFPPLQSITFDEQQ